jgi:glycine cleavage system transcriptional repressor
MTILRGHFTIMLIVSIGDDVDASALEGDLTSVRERLGLEAVVVNEVTGVDPSTQVPPNHIVSVYGVDHPGIVHSVTSSLARQQVNITDLTTRLIAPGAGEPLYAMMLEVVIPAGLSAERVEQSLQAVREREGVEVTIRPLEQDAL